VKYIQRFNESIKIGAKEYKKQLTEEDFLYLFNKNCNNFNINDRALIRGDKKLFGDFYYLNGKNRSVDYKWMMNCPIHLEFMRSKLWENLPQKDKSTDFGLDGNTQISSGFYGTVYRVIPYDNATFVMSDKLVGNYNTILNKDLSVQFLSNVNNVLKEFNDYFNEVTYDMKKLVSNLNKLFKDKNNVTEFVKNKTNNSDIILKIYDIIHKKNIDFKEYMENAYSPKSYTVLNYKEVLNSTLPFGWTDKPVLLIKSYLSNDFFRENLS